MRNVITPISIQDSARNAFRNQTEPQYTTIYHNIPQYTRTTIYHNIPTHHSGAKEHNHGIDILHVNRSVYSTATHTIEQDLRVQGIEFPISNFDTVTVRSETCSGTLCAPCQRSTVPTTTETTRVVVDTSCVFVWCCIRGSCGGGEGCCMVGWPVSCWKSTIQ